jgi:hypothetical protein
MDHITLSPDTHELNRVQLTLRVAALAHSARPVYLNYIAYRNTNAVAAPAPRTSIPLDADRFPRRRPPAKPDLPAPAVTTRSQFYSPSGTVEAMAASASGTNTSTPPCPRRSHFRFSQRRNSLLVLSRDIPMISLRSC